MYLFVCAGANLVIENPQNDKQLNKLILREVQRGEELKEILRKAQKSKVIRQEEQMKDRFCMLLKTG